MNPAFEAMTRASTVSPMYSVGYVRAKKSSSGRGESPEARGRVGEVTADEGADDPAEDAHAEAAGRADRVRDRAAGGETAADHEVRAGVEAGHQLPHLGGVVLAVGVELDRAVVVVADGVAEAGLQRTADAEVERQRQHRGAGLGGDVRGGVARAVVDDEHVEVRQLAREVLEDARQRRLLVERGDDDERPQLRGHACCPTVAAWRYPRRPPRRRRSAGRSTT